MLPFRSSALLASAALALGAALVPASALADSTGPSSSPTFTTTDLVAALTAAETPTAAVAKAGWVARGTDVEGHKAPEAMTAIYAVDHGAAHVGSEISMVEADHAGTYMTLAGLGPGRRTERALKALNRPRARWVFAPDRSLDLRDLDTNSAIAHLAPDLLLAQFVDPTRTTLTGTPTATAEADGSTTYAFDETDLTADGERGTTTVTIDAGGVVTAITSATTSDSGSVRYTYGAQHVALPARASTITLDQLREGSFLATLPRQVRMTATLVAQQATSTAHHHTVKVAAIRRPAARFARFTNRLASAKILSTRPIAGGVRIIGTNRHTHTHVAYTVTSTGTRAVCHKA